MLKLLQNTRLNGFRPAGFLVGSLALVALMAAPVAPALAQVPADMLRLDPPQPASHDGAKLAQDQRTKVRSAYARSRKPHAH
jgi:hypothetical protein